MRHVPTLRIRRFPNDAPRTAIHRRHQRLRAARRKNHVIAVDQRALPRIPERLDRSIVPLQIDSPPEIAGDRIKADDMAPRAYRDQAVVG